VINIGTSQLRRIDEASVEGYVPRAVSHLIRYAPALARSTGRAGVEAAARRGIAQARSCGFDADEHVRLYLELMVSFGSAFADDPQHGWLQRFLATDAALHVRERARLLHWHAGQYLDRVYGADGSLAVAEARRAMVLSRHDLDAVGRDYAAEGLRLLAHLNARRLEYVDMAGRHALLAAAAAESRRLGLTNASGPPSMLCLMFAFGHGVAGDPLYPWVAGVLSAGAPSPDARVDALLQRARDFLETMLASAGRETA